MTERFKVGDTVRCTRPDFNWRNGVYTVSSVKDGNIGLDGNANANCGWAGNYELVTPSQPPAPIENPLLTKFKEYVEDQYEAGFSDHSCIVRIIGRKVFDVEIGTVEPASRFTFEPIKE